MSRNDRVSWQRLVETHGRKARTEIADGLIFRTIIIAALSNE